MIMHILGNGVLLVRIDRAVYGRDFIDDVEYSCHILPHVRFLAVHECHVLTHTVLGVAG